MTSARGSGASASLTISVFSAEPRRSLTTSLPFLYFAGVMLTQMLLNSLCNQNCNPDWARIRDL